MPPQGSTKRSCATCNYCCVYLEIESKPGYSTRIDTSEDLAKPANQACGYLGDSGCMIYEVRPLVCRQFRCDWLLGVKGFGPDDSPVLTGVLGIRGDKRFISPDEKVLEPLPKSG